MRTVHVVTPSGARGGNRVTALRWARHLRALGWHVRVVDTWDGAPSDLLVALHARRSGASIERFLAAHPERPAVVAGTGTDLYRDLHDPEAAPEVLTNLRRATRIVVLQPQALDALPADVRERARVIYQSLPPPTCVARPVEDAFEVSFLAHLRAVKDPLLAARAARLLPASSRVRVVHAGALLDADLGPAVEREREENPRYRWLGALGRKEALELLARSRACLVTSRLEGGPNTITEALALGVPVLASDVPGNAGLLGEDYPGLFPATDEGALAELLARLEDDRGFRAELTRACRERSWIADPARERESWRKLLAELFAEARA